MSLNKTACLKSLCTAYNDFQQHPSDQTVQDLQRQIDALLGVSCLGGSFLKDFSPRHLIYAESLSALVGVINHPNLKNTVYQKAITALAQLAGDHETRTSLQTTFNLASSLSSFLLRCSSSSNKQLILQSLNLLQKMTYKGNCSIPSIYIGDVLRYIVKIVQSSSSDQCLASLSIIANLCHNDKTVQAFIKSMDDVKQLYKTLFKYLSHSNKSLSIVSLSILTSLVLNEDVGEKIFHGSNLVNIIQLVFNVLITKEDLSTRQYAADLIVELMNSTRILNVMTQCDMFNTYIYRILCTLHSTDPNITTKVLELLIAMCQKEETYCRVVTVFVKHSQTEEETQLPDETALSPAQALLHWISRTDNDDATVQANLLSMVFIREILTAVINNETVVRLSSIFDQLLPALIHYLTINLSCDDDKLLKQRCRKTTCVMEVLLTLCKDESFKSVIINQFDYEHLCKIVMEIYHTFSEDLKLLRHPALECSHEIVFLLFRALEFLSTLKHDVPSGQSNYTSLIQDGRIVPFLAHGMASKTKYLVHASLQIYAEGLKMKEFPGKILGDVISSHNSSRYKEMVALKSVQVNDIAHQLPSLQVAKPLSDITNLKQKESATMNILTEKLKKGLELKDSKMSDIMDFYEHKLASLMGRENHLQDLLETKTAALAQSDHLLAQYRCRQAQSEAECLKLRTLLLQSEKKGEVHTVKMDEFLKTKNALMGQISNLENQLKLLESVASEHKELTVLFQEQSQKLESMQQSLQAAEEEHQSLAAMNDCLHKNSEKLKSKLECANGRIKLMEDEKCKLSEQINVREVKIDELRTMLDKEKVNLQQKQEESDHLQKRCKTFEKDIAKFEKHLKESRQQANSLQLLCEQHEQTIREKDDSITQLNEDLEKQSRIAAMIHNLTSGKMGVTDY